MVIVQILMWPLALGYVVQVALVLSVTHALSHRLGLVNVHVMLFADHNPEL